MCGISGFNFEDKELIKSMMEKTRHRGPDDSGRFVSGGWSLGHNRLSIIDLSKAGRQPMKSSSGRFEIIFNGEIYNFKEIRSELQALGRKFSSGTDTEVILGAYELWGKESLRKFNGMFAFAILDREKGELFLARDQIGIKPLYYFFDGTRFIFSSEIKAIFAHDIPRILNEDMLSVYFRVLYVPAPHTMFKDVWKLEPGHYITFKDGKLKKTKYWQYADLPLVTEKEDILKRTKELVEDAVRLQLFADRKVGIFLSGGIDSTVIAGIAAKHAPRIATFSVGFESAEEGEKYNNDAVLARRTAELLKADHYELKLTAEDVKNALNESVYQMDEPISNHVQAVNMLLSKFASDKATVFLGGDGGDELFGGYERYYYSNLIDRFQSYPSILQKIGLAFLGIFGKGKLAKKLQSKPGAERYLEFYAQDDDQVASFFKRDKREKAKEIFQSLYFQKTHKGNFTRDFMRTDVMGWLPNESLARSDKMSMAASIEYRVPFLDTRLVEFADQIPHEMKLGKKGFNILSKGKHYEGKQILRQAMREYLPDFVLREPKWGWFSPAAKWIRGPLKETVEKTLAPDYNAGTKHLFDFEKLNQIFDDHKTKKKYALNTLWAVMTFQMWYKTFFESNGSNPKHQIPRDIQKRSS